MRSFLRQSLVVSTIVTGLLTTNSLQAELPTQDQPKEQHIIKGSRQAESTTQERRQEQKIEQELRETADKLQAGIQQVNFVQNGSSFSLLDNRSHNYNHFNVVNFPISCHWLNWTSADGRVIQIEDGSKWEIAPSDAYVTYSWRSDDAIFITPITSWFYSYDYYITNRSNNTYVKANLLDGPIAFGSLSHWIVNVDAYQGHVYLENQSVWCVDPSDVYLLRDWAPNDHIIMALHDSRFSSYDQVLINVNMDNQVHVKQY